MDILTIAAISAFVAFLGCHKCAVGRYCLSTRRSGAIVEVQVIHFDETCRLGGFPCYLALSAGALIMSAYGWSSLWVLLLCAGPVVASGSLDDIFGSVAPVNRLIAGIVSSLIWQSGADIPFFISSIWFGFDCGVVALFLTSFIVALFMSGVSHSWNLIDGVNGLAAGSGLCAVVTYFSIAMSHGDIELMWLSAILAGALSGFLLLNFPHAKIFLGDGGAYLFGFILAALAIYLHLRHAEISPVAGLLVLAYPLIETLFSIRRRIFRRGRFRPGQAFVADRLHLHSLLHRSVARRLARRFRRPEWRNPLTTFLILPLPAFCAVSAAVFAHSTWICLASGLLILAAYLFAYRRVALIRRRRPMSGRASLAGMDLNRHPGQGSWAIRSRRWI